ncbi:hypothetical protein NC661_16610 [Aquibacillus koreensis]|uniref:Transporter n=1 Tax=Aquibacillus koreensis TaxID=279446 RepID=A0A9X3WNA8_9BACI|nr:hypothetical protein [Aquibacillus koreensis]MCT2536873.1 hypothetical protein [Aquibacillus koreensis]MDC3421995.1 hypothetical protein [Aquibacillus koreensis]
MYFTNEKLDWGNMAEYDTYTYSVPVHSYNYPHVSLNERQLIPGFPWLGGNFTLPGFPSSPPPTAPGQGTQAGPPTSPPPTNVPLQTQQVETFAVDPGGIRRCLFRFTYVWLRGFQQFWFYPTFVGRNSVSGYRWNGFRWVYFGISLQQIQSFTCV